MAGGNNNLLFEMLLEESLALSGCPDVIMLLNRVLLRIREQLNAEAVSYFTVQGDRLRRVGHVCGAEVSSTAEEYPVSERVLGSAVENIGGVGVGTPLVWNEADRAAELTDQHGALATDLSSRRIAHLVVVGISGPGGLLGILRVVNKVENNEISPEGFSQADVSKLRALAGMLLLALLRVTETDRAVAETSRKEREQIADEIHDALNILHAGVLLAGEGLMQRLDELGHHDLAARLEQLREVARFTYLQLHAALQERRSGILEKDGLVAALEHYARQVAPTIISVRGSQKVRLPRAKERTLYGIAIGAISNALRHASLDKIPDGEIKASVDVKSGWARLCVRDNGQGFDVGSVVQANGARGLDLMRRMATSVGGTLTVTSAPGEGTEILVNVPLGSSYD